MVSSVNSTSSPTLVWPGWGMSDGETMDATMTRWSTVSRPMVAGGSSSLQVRPGIVWGAGTPSPFTVAAAGTPGRKVTVTAGTVIIKGNSSTTPPFGLTLTSNQDLDTATEHATLPRIDLVVARINSPGTNSAEAFVEVVTGTAAASPSRPTYSNTGSDHAIVLKTINVQPATISTVIRAQDVVTNLATDAGWTAAPGGFVPVTAAMATNGTLSDGVGLLTGQPFWSVNDNQPGYQLATGPELWGPLLRIFDTVGTTNAQGDFLINVGSYQGGALVADPFPNAFLGAVVTAHSDASASPQPRILQVYDNFCTTSQVCLRMFNHDGSVMASNALRVAGIAWGR